MDDLKAVVEQMNREKVNSYREVTSREDYIHRIEKENKQLKIEFKRMESTCNEQGEQLENLYSMLKTL
jgi:predicted RNase H-like nuclease (RuvC/YqgF family)